jgi:hypothetical protein
MMTSMLLRAGVARVQLRTATPTQRLQKGVKITLDIAVQVAVSLDVTWAGIDRATLSLSLAMATPSVTPTSSDCAQKRVSRCWRGSDLPSILAFVPVTVVQRYVLGSSAQTLLPPFT